MIDGKKHSPKKIFDVKRPGKTPAEPTSRPVIVGHKPEVHDDIIGANTSKLGSKEKRPLLNALAKVTIQPSQQIADQELPEPVPPVPESSIAPEPTLQPAQPPEVPSPQSPTLETPSPVLAVPTPPSDPLANPSFNLPTEPEPTTSQPKPLSDKLLADAAKAPENPNPMTRHGDQVYVSHHKSNLTFGTVLASILIILVLTAVAINLLLDADIIKTDLNVPHTSWL